MQARWESPDGMFPAANHSWIDDREAPLYVVTYPAERTDAEVREAHDAIFGIYQSCGAPVTWVVDASRVGWASASQRRIVAEHERRVGPYARRWCAGLALVVPNPAVRGLLTAVTWMTPLDYPHDTFNSVAAATQWARERVRAAPGP